MEKSDAVSSGAGCAIAIPTYRRPEQLAELLTSLIGDLQGRTVPILVADNDPAESARPIIGGFRARGLDITYLVVTARGVSHVRNALVAACFERLPDWRWLAMLDDDGLVTRGWLDALIGCGERLDAHLVGGPVEGVLPPDANILARNSVFASRRRWPTGLVETLNTTQNLAVSRRLFDLIGLPLFQPQYGASGGEDYELFRRAKRAGGRLAWCDEALVREPAPADRLTIGGLLFRYYSTGAYSSVIDSAYDGTVSTAMRAAKGVVSSTLQTLAGGLRLDGNRAAKGALVLSHFVGRVGGLLGARTSRYVDADAAAQQGKDTFGPKPGDAL